MASLHRCNYAERSETRDVLERDDLRMLDAEPVIGRRNCLQRRVERIQNDAIPAVSDGMHSDLESAAQRTDRYSLNVCRRRHDEPGISRLIRVRCEQRRTTRAECAVSIHLDA